MSPDTDLFGYNILEITTNVIRTIFEFPETVDQLFSGAWVIQLKLFLIFLSLIFLAAFVYVFFKYLEIRKEYKKFYTPRHSSHEEKTGFEKHLMQEPWQAVASHMASNNPSDWKLAIIEADALLDELTKSLSLPGETLGERLKVAGRGEIKNLDAAWEAHKVRNRIAHEGARMNLTRAEGERTLAQFERVLREFEYI